MSVGQNWVSRLIGFLQYTCPHAREIFSKSLDVIVMFFVVGCDVLTTWRPWKDMSHDDFGVKHYDKMRAVGSETILWCISEWRFTVHGLPTPINSGPPPFIFYFFCSDFRTLQPGEVFSLHSERLVMSFIFGSSNSNLSPSSLSRSSSTKPLSNGAI